MPTRIIDRFCEGCIYEVEEEWIGQINLKKTTSEVFLIALYFPGLCLERLVWTNSFCIAANVNLPQTKNIP